MTKEKAKYRSASIVTVITTVEIGVVDAGRGGGRNGINPGMSRYFSPAGSLIINFTVTD